MNEPLQICPRSIHKKNKITESVLEYAIMKVTITIENTYIFLKIQTDIHKIILRYIISLNIFTYIWY